MNRAKEGSRTPTRVTPLEPEGTVPSEKQQSSCTVTDIRDHKVRPQNAAGNSRSPQDNGACTGIPFAPGDVVEITDGMSKGLRGTVLGPARSMYLGVADVALRMEFGREAWIRPDWLRRLG
jgi:hypothetical protein